MPTWVSMRGSMLRSWSPHWSMSGRLPPIRCVVGVAGADDHADEEGTRTSASKVLTMSQALIDAPVTTWPAHRGTATMLISWSTTTTDTARGRSDSGQLGCLQGCCAASAEGRQNQAWHVLVLHQ